MAAVDQVLQWEPVVLQLALMGVQTFGAIKSLMQDAGADDATITTLEGKWEGLRADVLRAAGGVSPTP